MADRGAIRADRRGPAHRRHADPDHGIWIAAQVFESGAELLSFDAHLAAVPGLAWTQLR